MRIRGVIAGHTVLPKEQRFGPNRFRGRLFRTHYIVRSSDRNRGKTGKFHGSPSHFSEKITPLTHLSGLALGYGTLRNGADVVTKMRNVDRFRDIRIHLAFLTHRAVF